MNADPSTPDLEPQVLALRVINLNEFPLYDRFDGTLFEFPNGQPVDVPVDAAYHIFGWFPAFTDKDGKLREPDPLAMRSHCQRRFGWNTPAMMEKGRSDLFFDNISFRPIKYRMVAMGDGETPFDQSSGAQEQPPAVPLKPERAPRVNKLMAAAEAAAAR